MSNVAIIGAGIGGLFAGNLLVKRGHRTTIFESHSSPGGYTAGFWKKGFYFESGTLSFESSPVIFKAMKEIGIYEKINFTRQVIGIRFSTADGVCSSYNELKKFFLSAFPKNRINLTRYFSEVDKMCRAMTGIMGPANFVDYLLYPLRLITFVRLYKKYEKVTITDFTAGFFDRGSDLFCFFKSMGYPDMSAALIPGAFLSFFDDYWTVADGMQSWADILAQKFVSLGGELKLKAPVERIITKNGTATGVACNGMEYSADYVISASDYKKTFLKLLDDRSILPVLLQEKVKKNAVSEGVFTVYLGLKIDNELLKKYMKVPHVLFYDEKPGADIHNATDEKYFEKASIMIYSPSLHNPKLAPGGKSSLMLQMSAPYHWMNNWGNGDKDKYRKLKEEVKKALINKASAVIPGLKSIIEYEDAATPLTYERYTANTDGATSAWSWNPKNRFYNNIMRVYVNTPVKNLLIGSCWASQIGGIPGAIAAARACVKRVK